jgi:hypothetical protein
MLRGNDKQGRPATPFTFAYEVTLEIEEKVQPAKASFGINSVSKDLAEGVNERTLIVP